MVRRGVYAWALLALVVLVASCGSPPPSVVVWHAYAEGEERALQELAKDFEARTGERVELLAIPHDAYSAKLESAVPHGHGPDVFIDSHERLGSFLKNGIVAAVGDALPDEDVASYEPLAVAAVTDGDQRYAVPLSTKCLALFLNEDLAPPRLDTLGDLTRLRATLPSGSYPLAYEAQTVFFNIPFVHAFGAHLFADGGYALVGPEAGRAAEYVRDLVRSGMVPEEADGGLVKRLFVEGRAAGVISGPWFSSGLPASLHVKVAPLPVIGGRADSTPALSPTSIDGAGRMRPYLTVEGAFLSPMGASKPAARAFARFLGSDDAAKLRAKVGRQVVTSVGAWADPALANDAVLSAFHEAGKEALVMPTSTAFRAAWVPAEEALRKVLRGGTATADALDEGRARYEDAMRPPPPPPSPMPLLCVLGGLFLLGAFFAVRRAQNPELRRQLRASLPAYRYVAHAALVVLILVVLPLVAGAATSFFAGTRQHPEYVGLSNYAEILTARGRPLLSNGSFYVTLLVTVLWTVANVTMHVTIGLVLGILLSRPFLRLKAVYRVLLILPWAVPSYVTALAWKGMFHKQFGAINAILGALGAPPVSWFSHFSTAFAANVATNVWLGFPFMMVVTLGALTSVPKDVLEAAEVDGATRWQRFRLVTLPLLRPALLPAVVLGAVWTFNMFNVVFLVSGGAPDGSTDILISEAYRWAFTRDAQYGYAAAYAVLIFGLLLLGSRTLSRLGGKREGALA